MATAAATPVRPDSNRNSTFSPVKNPATRSTSPATSTAKKA